MRATGKSASGTSFHNDTIKASVSDLRKILGVPEFSNNDGRDKVNFEWVMETEQGEVFTVYDWKEYRRLTENEIVEWHVGSKNGIVTAKAVNEMTTAFNNIF